VGKYDHYKYYIGGGLMLKSGDLSYIVGSMQFSGYLRQAGYGYDGNSFEEQVMA
jgi:hypothetical protein